MNPAPAFSLNSRTGMVAVEHQKGCVCENEYWVFMWPADVWPHERILPVAQCLRCHVQVVGLVHALGDHRCFVKTSVSGVNIGTNGRPAAT